MAEALTDLTLRKALAHDGGRVEIWDTKIPGFGVRISPSGHKSFILMYRYKVSGVRPPHSGPVRLVA